MSRDTHPTAAFTNNGREGGSPSAETEPPKSAQRLGRYRLIAEIGRGGMANVYLAVLHGQMGFNKLVVIKCMKPELIEDPQNVQMFLDEARLAAMLSHPNIVQTHEAGEDGGQLYLVMEYLPGQPLHIVRRRAQAVKQPFSLPLFCKILADSLSGLHYAHDLKKYDGSLLHLVHRDVSPQNIFVTYDGIVKVVDFGIAKISGRSTETATGIVKGKVAYMAPEQVIGEVDRRTDIFCAGIMLWEAATEKRMWSGQEDLRILHKLSQGKWTRSPKEVCPEVPDEIDKICQKALAPSADERYQTAAEFRRDLQMYIEGLPERMSENDVSNFMNLLFKEEQGKIFSAIEEQFAKINSASTGKHVSLVNFRPSFSNTGSSGPITNNTATGNENFTLRTGTSKISRGLDQGFSEENDTKTRTTAASDKQTDRHLSTGASAKAKSVGLALGAMALLSGGLFYYVQSRTNNSGAVAAMPSAAPSSAPPLVQEFQLRISTQPLNAAIYIGNLGPLASPYAAQLSGSSGPQSIRVEAKGYLPFTKDVTLDLDVSLAVTLDPDESTTASKPKGRGGASVSHGKSTSSSSGSAAPTSGDTGLPPTKVKRNIDTEVPF